MLTNFQKIILEGRVQLVEAGLLFYWLRVIPE
jgi:hypothetical protein